jgi:hypothetical protein
MELAVQTPTHEAHPAYVTQDLVSRLLARCCRVGVVALTFGRSGGKRQAQGDNAPCPSEASS